MSEITDYEIFKQVVENSFDSSWMLTLPEFNLIYANREATEKLLGYPIEKFYENRSFWFSIVHPDDVELAAIANQKCLNEGQAETRYRMIRHDGNIVWLLIRLRLMRNDKGEPQRIIGNSMDVTDIHLKEVKLKASEELFQSLANFAPIGIYQTDTEGRCTFVNKLWCEIAGLTQDEARGDAWAKTIHPEDVENVFTTWKRTAAKNEDFHFDFRFNNPTLGVRYVSSIAVPVFGIDGKSLSYVGTIEDVTDKVKQNQKLVASAKMSSLGEMASGIAHEINNPLMIIIGLCTKIKRMVEKDEIDRELVLKEFNKIESTSFRISKIINGLRAFTRNAENDQMTAVHIDQIIEETLELCRQRFTDHAIEFKVNYGDRANGKFLGRPSQISQVILNLLSNSFDAIETLKEKWVEITVKVQDNSLFVEVTDSGRGIPSEVVEKMMNPFFTTKEVGRGTGLGLSISQGILEEHKGKIFYDGASANTKFVIQLPVAE